MTLIKKKKLYEEVILGIEEMLRSNNMQTGDRLQSEKELALYFGVSKTAVREALSALQTAGLIEVKHGSGIFVRNVNEKLANPLTMRLLTDHGNLLGLMELRIGLETEGAYLGAQRANAVDIGGLKTRLLSMAEEVERGDNAAQADLQFHCAVIKATHNEAYSKVFDTIAAVFQEGMHACHEYLLLNQGAQQILLEEHRLIYDAIKKKQPDKARDLMRAHLEHIVSTLRDLKT
jgi:GntR family transcriptional regulator, transcriptional repressor for pyruvate dehydrogenase complex